MQILCMNIIRTIYINFHTQLHATFLPSHTIIYPATATATASPLFHGLAQTSSIKKYHTFHWDVKKI